MTTPHPARAALAQLFADGRERTATDACNAIFSDGSENLQYVRSHMCKMREWGLLSRDETSSGIAIYRRAGQ